MTEISLQATSVVTLVGECIAAGVAKHVRVDRERQLGGDADALDLAIVTVLSERARRVRCRIRNRYRDTGGVARVMRDSSP